MAVSLMGRNRYVGLSSDTKPTSSFQSFEFYELDTGQTYFYNGTTWVQGMGARRGNFTDGSGTLTLGGTAQDALAANPARTYLFIQNQDGTEDLWVNVGVTAVRSQPSMRISAGDSMEYTLQTFVPTGRISVIGATTGQAWTAKEA